jgi:hypothetical protein
MQAFEQEIDFAEGVVRVFCIKKKCKHTSWLNNRYLSFFKFFGYVLNLTNAGTEMILFNRFLNSTFHGLQVTTCETTISMKRIARINATSVDIRNTKSPFDVQRSSYILPPVMFRMNGMHAEAGAKSKRCSG